MLYKNDEDLASEILGVLEGADEPLSATAISKGLGYSKLRMRVSAAIQTLVGEEKISAEANKGGFNVYSLNEGVEEAEETEAVAEVREITEITLPQDLKGYDVELQDKGHVKVVFPCDDEGCAESSVVLEPNERLVVINQNEEYRFVASSPEQLLEAIAVYTSEVGITTYLVTDMATGNAVLDVNEVDMKVAIIFLEISRHDKAGN